MSVSTSSDTVSAMVDYELTQADLEAFQLYYFQNSRILRRQYHIARIAVTTAAGKEIEPVGAYCNTPLHYPR
jgi:hypothetical protein